MKWLLYLLMTLFLTGLARESHAESPYYAGLKYGLIQTDFPFTDDGTFWAGLFGARVSPNLDLELEFGSFESDNQVLDGDYLGLYAATSIGETLYLRLRCGVIHEELNFSLPRRGARHTGLSFGLGGGYRINPRIDLLLSYLWMEGEMNSLSFGAVYRF